MVIHRMPLEFEEQKRPAIRRYISTVAELMTELRIGFNVGAVAAYVNPYGRN
ncbi:hypothetical protein AEYBE204_14735 [Asticcacaulis sp. YBE204]|nr:hypothetical protein AEYBE204_14735 [Asticcacaulis sp. YBE204]